MFKKSPKDLKTKLSVLLGAQLMKMPDMINLFTRRNHKLATWCHYYESLVFNNVFFGHTLSYHQFWSQFIGHSLWYSYILNSFTHSCDVTITHFRLSEFMYKRGIHFYHLLFVSLLLGAVSWNPISGNQGSLSNKLLCILQGRRVSLE